MTIERVLEFGFKLVKKEPKIILPSVLNWIPFALFTILILQGTLAFGEWFNLDTISQIVNDKALFWDIARIILTYIVIAIPILMTSVVINLILTCAYSDITRQVYSRRKILLTNAFSTAKTKFLYLLWTYFLEFLIIILILAGLFGLLIISLFTVKALGLLGFMMVLITGLIGIIAVFLAAVFFYETPAIVVLENKSGLEAIKRSYIIGRRNFWSLVIIILFVGTVVSTVNGGLSSIPHVGFILSNTVGLFLSTWWSTMPSVFYYEYERKKRHEE